MLYIYQKQTLDHKTPHGIKLLRYFVRQEFPLKNSSFSDADGDRLNVNKKQLKFVLSNTEL